MSVMIETSLGEVVVDLFCDEAPLAAKNFLKLCKIKYYNGCLFYNVQQNFMIQAGDPTATGKGGTSVYGLMYGEQARFFEDEISATSRKHDEAGLLSMANMGVPNSNGSQFFFSMRGDDMQHLDGKHTVFAKVMEGMEILEKINGQFCDDNGRPYRDIRILHTYVLDDPFDDPPQLVVPDESPDRDRPVEERVALRLGALDEVSLEVDEKTELEKEKQLREKTARSNAVVLEMIGDLPDADMKPPENVLFVCKLNPVTTDDDLEIIFTSRFGTCRAEICRDHVTGDSLNYAFVEFEAIESCEEAFKKMNNVLIDDRRIRVDFSQSVAKEWSKYKGRAQGGQKLASGKGGRAVRQQQQLQQQQQQASKNNRLGGTAVSSFAGGGQQRKSKWGDAPTGAAAVPAAVPPPVSAREGRRGDGNTSHHHGGSSSSSTRRGGTRSEAAHSRWSGTADGTTTGGGGDSGRRRRGDGRREHSGREGGGGGGGRRDDGGGGSGGHAEIERRDRANGRNGGGGGGGGGGSEERRRRRDEDGSYGGEKSSRSDRAGGGGGGLGRTREGDEGRNGRGVGGHRHSHHLQSDGRQERDRGHRGGGAGRDERLSSTRKGRSRSRSRERGRGNAGSRDRGGRR
ncbi:unnamed protein product [Pylaiella littoralis]